nr:reverse transcriptase domain-containing protein [Tanacetum cinerariifolium]
DQDSLNVVAGGNLLEKSPQDALTIIENKSKVWNSRSKPIASPVNACDNHSSFELAKLTHAVTQQTGAVTTTITAMLKQFQSNPPPTQVKAVEEICITCGGAHSYYQCLAAGGNTFLEFKDNIQGYVSAATCNYNQGNLGYRPQYVANQMRPPGFAQLSVQNHQNRFGQPQGFNRSTNFNHEQPYQATQSNQNFHLNELEKIKKMNDVSLKAMQNQIDMMNIASTLGSGTLPGNTIANPKGELKAITTRSGLVTEGPTVLNPPKSVNLEEAECVEETYTDPDVAEYTIKIPPPPPALVLMPKYQKMLKALLSNKEKLQELANTHLNENCSVVILKKLPEKLGNPGKFLIPCGFSELKCKALADLGASINLMPLTVWKKLGLPDLIPTRMTLELANRAICTPDGIARDVFVPVGKFTFSANFVIVDYESDPRFPLILGRPFLRTARALIDVHGEEMILRDGDERLTLNMKHDTDSYSIHPHRESELPDIDSFNDIHRYFDDDPLSGSTTYSANSLLEEFADELALILYPPDYDDTLTCDIESDIREIEFLLSQGEDSDFKDSIDQSVLTHCDDLFVDPTLKMFTDKQPPDYSFPPRFDVDDVLPSPDNEDKYSRIYEESRQWIYLKSSLSPLFNLGITLKKTQKEQNRIKTRQKREAWRSREKSEAVTVSRGRKTEENAKRRAGNANTCKFYRKEEDKRANFIGSYKVKDQLCLHMKVSGTFHFPADFVVVDFDADPRVPLILGRSFLKTERALIDLFEGELTLRVGKESITFNLDQTSRYSANYNDMTAKQIDVIDMACEEYSQEFLGFSDVIASGNPTPYYDPIVSTTSSTLTPFENSDFLLKEVDAFLALEDDPTSPEVDQSYLDSEGDILLLEAFLNDDPSLPPPNQGNYMPEVRKELKICEAKSDKSLIDEPLEVKLKDLPPHLEYAFLEGDDKLPVIIAKDLSIEEKTALITDDFEPVVQHQRKVNPKIHDVIKQEVLKLFDAGLIYPIFDSPWVSPVHCVPKKGGFTVVENKDNDLILTRLVTGWRVYIDYCKLNEATHKDHFPLPFMDQMLERLAGNQYYCFLDGFSGYFRIPINLKDQEKTKFTCHMKRLFTIACLLGYAMHWARFRECVEAFQTLKRKLTKAPILIAPDWDIPFELMCDARDFAIGAVLGQRQDKHFRPIHYASKTMTEAESNYTTTKKEILAVVYAFEKFRSYLIMNKSIVYTDHSALKYLFAKKDSKARLLRWVLLLQELTFKIAGDHRKVQLNELHDQANKNSLIYKEKTKRLYDSKIKDRVLTIDDRVLLFYSRLKIFSGKLKSCWSGPFTISQVYPYGTVELAQPDMPNFKVNGHRRKHYFGEDVPKMVVSDLQTFPKDH